MDSKEVSKTKAVSDDDMSTIGNTRLRSKKNVFLAVHGVGLSDPRSLVHCTSTSRGREQARAHPQTMVAGDWSRRVRRIGGHLCEKSLCGAHSRATLSPAPAPASDE